MDLEPVYRIVDSSAEIRRFQHGIEVERAAPRQASEQHVRGGGRREGQQEQDEGARLARVGRHALRREQDLAAQVGIESKSQRQFI